MTSHDDTVLTESWANSLFAVVDVESNGQSPPELIELGIVPIDCGRPGNLRSWLICPVRGVRRRVAEVHGIRDADLVGAPRIDDVREAIFSALQGRYLVAHNAGVDWSILHLAIPTLNPPGVIDTLRLSRALAPGLSSYRLVDLLTVLDIENSQHGPAHRVAHDVHGATQLFLSLIARHANGSMALRELLQLGRLRTIDEPCQGKLF